MKPDILPHIPDIFPKNARRSIVKRDRQSIRLEIELASRSVLARGDSPVRLDSGPVSLLKVDRSFGLRT